MYRRTWRFHSIFYLEKKNENICITNHNHSLIHPRWRSVRAMKYPRRNDTHHTESNTHTHTHYYSSWVHCMVIYVLIFYLCDGICHIGYIWSCYMHEFMANVLTQYSICLLFWLTHESFVVVCVSLCRYSIATVA